MHYPVNLNARLNKFEVKTFAVMFDKAPFNLSCKVNNEESKITFL